MHRSHLGLFAALAIAGGLGAQQAGIFAILKTAATIGRQSDGSYLVPTSQLLKPWGEMQPILGRPVDMTFDTNRRVLAVLNWRGVALLDASNGVQLAELKSRSTSYTGIAYRPGDRELWASETTRNGPDSILIVELNDIGLPVKESRIALPGHPLPAGIAFSKDGSTAFVAFSRNNSLAVIDVAARKVKHEVPVGIAPFSVVSAPKQDRVFVSNRGGRRPAAGQNTAPSSGSAVLSDPRTGTTVSGTVSAIDTRTVTVSNIDVGLAPSMMALSGDQSLLAVANAHSDSVSLLDARTLKRTDVKIPAYPEDSVGSQPVALAFSPTGDELYVACGGNNAIAVLRKTDAGWRVGGAMPAAWFPSAIAVDAKGGLRVLSIKGVGSTGNHKGSFNSRQYEGAIETMPAPMASQLEAGTREVRAANSPKFEPQGGVANLASLGIEHVLFIVKENRTYDQLFGDIAKGNGDPQLAMYGGDVTPNHHALAERYVLLDNFYTGGAISFDGHQWLMQAFVSDYVEKAFAASPRGYAWNMSDALTVAPAGFFWQSALKPLGVRIYGEFCLPAKYDIAKKSAADMNEYDEKKWPEYWKMYKERKWDGEVGCKSGVPALAPYMSARYPHSSQSIPDSIRAEEFIRELGEMEKKGSMPNLMILTLNEDHTNGTNPDSPRPRAMVAENDEAMGRIVEAVSKSKFWAKSLILVTEDDAQDGLDHVDGHRTIALAIGPQVLRSAVVPDFYTHSSMVRTIQTIFGIPAKTRALAAARPMNAIFTAEADLKPYSHIPAKIALDEMNPPVKALKGRQRWAAQLSAEMNWKEPDDVPSDVLNRILWWDAKGFDTPYPDLKAMRTAAARR